MTLQVGTAAPSDGVRSDRSIGAAAWHGVDMSTHQDDAVLSETLERIRQAELATVLYPPGTPEHARAVERLERATRQMVRLSHPPIEDEPGPDGSSDTSDEPGAEG